MFPMPLLHLIILAIVQGITEFLPISSSGHLVIAHAALGHDEMMSNQQEKVLDIAVHLGTLIAVCAYFYRDLMGMIKGGIDLLMLRFKTPEAQKSLLILVASLPVIIVGFGIAMMDVAMFDHLVVIGWTTLIFGIVLWLADRNSQQTLRSEDLSWKHALIIGCSQILALIPGTSRSGITMTAARGLGYSRIEAARFSMLLGIVAISGAGVLTSLDVFEMQDFSFTKDLAIAAGLSCIAAFIAIALMMKWLVKSTFTPFAIYRVLLGGALLIIAYGGYQL